MPQLPSSTIHIIGGGPSAKGIPFEELKGPIIGANDSFFNAPCDWVVSIDGRWMRHRWERLKSTNAKAWLREDSYIKHVGNHSWPNLMLGKCQVWEEAPGPGLNCLNGNNSGLVALCFGYWMFAPKRVFLYGFDMSFTGKKHWFPEYEWAAKGNGMYPAFIAQFERLSCRLKAENIDVYNVCPESKLPYFKKVNYETAKNLFIGLHQNEQGTT